MGRSDMKKVVFFLTVGIIAGLFFPACNKKAIPSITDNLKGIAYDSSAFEYIFTEALKQKFLGNAGDALKYLEQCVEINPKSDAAYYEMAQIALMLSDTINGKKFVIKAVTINEKNLWYLMLAANVYYEAGLKDSAILFYEKAIKYFPEEEDVKINLAKILSEKGEYKKADEIYSYFETKYADNESISISRIKNFMDSGEWEKAEEIVNNLLSKNPDGILYNGLLTEIYRKEGKKEKAIAIYEKLLLREPGNPQTLLSLCDFLISEKQYDDLFAILNRVILSDSVSREDKISLMARIVEDSSLVSTRSKEIELSLLLFEATAKNDYIIMLLRPELYKRQNNLTMATERLEMIIKERSENYYAWENLLLLYSETKNWDKLFIRGKECATKFNTSLLPKVLYANAAIEKGQYDIASEELRKGRILAGNDPGMELQVLVMQADLYYKKGDFIKSWDLFNEALKMKPDDVMVLNNYAYYLAEQGQNLKEAERMARIVIEREKDNTTYLDTYAWIIFKRGRDKEALKIMERILNLDEKPNAEWFEHIGYILKSLGKCDKAIGYWKLAIQQDSRKTILLREIENCEKH